MADLDNSKRSLPRATYTPIKRPARENPQARGTRTRAWEKWSYMAALAPSRSEAQAILRRMAAGEVKIPAAHERSVRRLRSALSESIGEPHGAFTLEGAPRFADISPEVLVAFGEELVRLRSEAVEKNLAEAERIVAAYRKETVEQAPAAAAPEEPPEGFKLDRRAIFPTLPNLAIYRMSERRVLAAPVRRPSGATTLRPAPGTAGEEVVEAVMAVRSPAAAAPEPIVAVPREPTIGEALNWALRDKTQAASPERLLAAIHTVVPEARAITIGGARALGRESVGRVKDIIYAFAERMHIEPVGFLHLERLDFAPAGIERGELKYSVPLSPGEEVNISHKEWSNTSEEFERIVTDYLEAFSEEGVTEKSELAQSTQSQEQHSNGFNLGVTASGGYGPVSISTTVGYNIADSSSRSEQIARNHSNEITRKASTRAKKEHKVSFKVASAAGTEDQTVRRIHNPFTDRATRVDYYQLVRKWRVDLYRYGVRLTYDLTIPEPGSDILSKIQEIGVLTAALAEGFGSPSSTLSWARFDLRPTDITRSNYLAKAAEYGAAIDPPPAETTVIVRSFTRSWANREEAQRDEYISFDVEVAPEYEVRGWAYSWERWAWEDASWHFDIRTDLNTWLGASGRLTLTVGTCYVSAFDIELKLTLRLRDSAFQSWQMRAWETLREAARARYEANRASLKDRLARLQEELGAQDALSLRQIEREEVMKGVLRWLFGPSFTFVPPGLPSDLYGADESVVSDTVWAKVLAQGEVIKFLHHAIEWENMLYFLYPYFWSHTSRWDFKKYLDHPDFLHRSFLRAGSARVVLTIRPGFETEFVSFLETGTFDGLPPGHPYLTIAEEMQAFARTNYPGIRSANPVEGARPLLSPRQRKSWSDMENIIRLLERYRELHGAYPTTAQGLAALAPLGTVPAADAWGNPYQYRSPGEFTDYELVCLGADGAPGGDGENADIPSWAEASLIGRWYEYTPTSALDIAFNETLPSA